MADYIDWVMSPGSGREFPCYVFSADTDMPTAGKVALVSLDGREIILTELTAVEWNCPTVAEGGLLCEQRINAALGRDDLRMIWLVRSEDTFDGRGLSFQEFQERWTPPRLFYRDIFELDGEAEVVRAEASIAEFELNGGSVRWVK